MNVSPKKIFTFHSALLIQRLLEVSSGCMPSAPPNSILIKWRVAYWCCFSVLTFPLPSPLENFLPTPLAALCLILHVNEDRFLLTGVYTVLYTSSFQLRLFKTYFAT